MWPTLETYVSNALVHLMKNGFVDDDQTLLLMSYLSHKDIFELHPVSNQDWFVVFKDFNNE
jgi:hypothetical protein